jgi:hypothetical protein
VSRVHRSLLFFVWMEMATSALTYSKRLHRLMRPRHHSQTRKAGVWASLRCVDRSLFLGALFVVACGGVAESGAQEAGLIEIYEHWGTYALDAPPSDMMPIVLQVPKAFLSRSGNQAARSWGLNLITFYPSFTSPLAPENVPFIGRCAGDCNGQILISVNNRTHTIHHPDVTRGIDYPNMGDEQARFRISERESHTRGEMSLIANGDTVTALEPLYEFDGGYEVRSPPGKGGAEQIHQYLFHLSGDHIHYDVTAECSINEFARKCAFHFSLKCSPVIYVQVTGLEMKHLGQWKDAVARVDRFVSSMVRVPACPPTGS